MPLGRQSCVYKLHGWMSTGTPVVGWTNPQVSACAPLAAESQSYLARSAHLHAGPQTLPNPIFGMAACPEIGEKLKLIE